MALLNDSFGSLNIFYENATTVIYKGVRTQDNLPVILKTYKNPDDAFRIKREYDLLLGKNIPGAGRVLEVSYNDDRSYLVREDCGAAVLDDYIGNNTLDTASFLRLARNAALALSTIHAAGILHCDIKPANMLVHPDTLDVTFIDFGISFSTHQRAAQQSTGFAGTLEFMAPEQTGRLDMKVDPRSDLYSLGITFYYLLARQLPFHGDSAVEIIHAQMVQPPPPLSQLARVDATVEAIVLKLMEKAPRKRYQSADSLAYDLGRCAESLRPDGTTRPLMLGEKDVFASLESGQRLFGKEKDLAELSSVYSGTKKNESALVLLHGPSGSGKSSLLEAFEDVVEQSNGYFLRGCYDWRNTTENYSGIRNMFEGFELFAYNTNLPLPEYRARLLETLGENAGVLVDIIPSFESILGAQPRPKRLNPIETTERARLVFRQMLQVLCDAPYPFVLVFDDIQWATSSDLDLLLSAIEGGIGNCVMLLSYHDDPAFLHSFSERLRVLGKGVAVTEIVSKHLSTSQIAKVLEDLFDAEEIEARSLANVLYEATGGVMDKLRLLLQAMYRASQIQYDAAADKWSIHLENLDENVLKGIEDRYNAELDALPEADRQLLQRLSCMGETFGANDTALAFGCDRAALEETLARLSAAGWLAQSKSGFDLWSFDQKAAFDLCYASLPDDMRDETHRQIVEKLYPVYMEDGAAMLAHSALFTRQVNATGRSGYDRDILHDIARYQLTVALQYMQAANMQQAVKEFASGLRLLGRQPFTADYTLAYELFLQYSLCCYALHEDTKAARLLETVLQNAIGEDDIYNAYFKAVEQYLARAEWERAKEYARRYLQAAGLLLDESADPMEAGEREYQRFLQLSGEDGIRVCLHLDFTNDRILEHHGNMLTMLAEALSFSLDRNCRYYLYKAINLAIEQQGLFSQFVKIFPVAIARYVSVREYARAKDLFDTGLEYAEATGSSQAFLWCVYGNMVTHWVNPLSEVLEVYKKAKYHAMLEGNAFYEAYADMMLLNYHSFVGEHLEEFHAETMATLHHLERSGLQALRANFTTFRQYARCLLGRTDSDDSFNDAQFTEDTFDELKGTWHGTFNEAFYYVCRMRAAYIHLHFDLAVQYAEKYRQFNETVNMTAYLTHVQFYYCYSMALLELCRLQPERKEEYLARILENQNEQKRFAEQNPQNFEHKYRLVETGIKGLDYQGIELVDEFAAEHKAFMDNGMIWDAIFVERLIGNFWIARGIPQYEVIHKNNRLVHYRDIGARVCVRILGETDETSLMRKREARERERIAQAAYGTGRATGLGTGYSTYMQGGYATGTFVSQLGSSIYGGSGTQRAGLNAALDFEALLGVLERLIRIGTLDQLAGEMAGTLLQNGNAEKALVFLADGPFLRLAAARHAREDKSDFTESEFPLELEAVNAALVPKRLVSMAFEKGETSVANNARNEFLRIGDEYLTDRAPESFLCLPVEQGGRLLGVVYLENASLPGAFPEGRVQFLAALLRQASALVLNLQNHAKLEEYTKDLEKRLSSYLAQQNALIAGIAHEINSPVGVCLTVATKVHEKTLAVIEAFNQKQLGMRALYKYLEETRDGLDIINNNVMRAGDLMQNFKKMSVEQSTEVFETLDLAPTLRSIVEYIRPGVKKKVDSIDIEVPEELRVYTSSGVLAQVFTNLIMNSAIHGFEDRPKEQCRIQITVTDKPATDEIEIRYGDNGKGMDAQEKEKVFQPFFTTKRNRGGSGLGGHIILSCVTQQLRGSVICESEEGEGTTFTIRLPKGKPQDQEG